MAEAKMLKHWNKEERLRLVIEKQREDEASAKKGTYTRVTPRPISPERLLSKTKLRLSKRDREMSGLVGLDPICESARRASLA